MYIPGRLRTASRPSSTDRCSALYALGSRGLLGAGLVTPSIFPGARVDLGDRHDTPERTGGLVLRQDVRVRDLARLPKAHLHLHFAGAMRPSTLRELAAEQ